MSKRTLTAVIVLAILAAGAIGGLIGFTWHAPGRTSTWEDIRNWATALAVIIGVPVALYQLSLQRRQLRDQQHAIRDEFKRNKRRDALLDGQLRELEQRDQFIARAQAEEIDLTWSFEGTGSFAQGINDSRRPLRDITCHVKPGPGSQTPSTSRMGQRDDAPPHGK